MPQIAKMQAIIDQEKKIKSVKKLLAKMTRQLEILRKRNKADREKERRNKSGRDLNKETELLRQAIQGSIDDFGESSSEDGGDGDGGDGPLLQRPCGGVGSSAM